MRAKIVLALVSLTSVAFAQTIQKWKTPDGKLYFGAKPPAGSTNVGQVGEPASSSPASSIPAPSSDTALEETSDHASVRVSLERKRIERALNDAADRLVAIRARIKEAKDVYISGRRDDLASSDQVAQAANFATDKNEALTGLKAEERTVLAEIGDLWERADALEHDLLEKHEGVPPAWWRPPSCRSCPSRGEIKAALR